MRRDRLEWVGCCPFSVAHCLKDGFYSDVFVAALLEQSAGSENQNVGSTRTTIVTVAASARLHRHPRKRELGEPERAGYKDSKIPAVVVPGPTYSCHRGTPARDTLIQNHAKDP